MYTKFLNCLNSSSGLREAAERLLKKKNSTQEDFIAEYKAHKKDVTKSCYQELLAQANCVHTATTQAEAVNRCHGNTSSFSIIRPAAGVRLQKQDAFPSHNWAVGNVAATACAPGAVGSAACTYGANMMYSGSGIDQRFDNYV